MSGSSGAFRPERGKASGGASVVAEHDLREEENAGDPGCQRGDAGGEDGGEACAEPDGSGHEKEHQGAEEKHTGRGCDVTVGGTQAGLEPVGVDQAGHGLVAASAAVCVVIGALELFPSEQGVRRGLLLLAGYPFMTGLFYLVYRRWGRLLGAPPRVGGACLVLAVLAWWLLLTDEAVLQQLAFWLGQTALLVSGVSLGGWLAVVAYRKDAGLWAAIRAVAGAAGIHPVWRREPPR